MKVLHVYKTYYPDSFGGIEQSIRHLANGCGVHGIHSEVFTLSPSPQAESIEYEGHRIHQAKANIQLASTPLSLSAFAKFADLAKQFDLIHYHYPYPFADLLKLATFVKKPSIVTYHSDIIRQRRLKYIYAPLQALFLRSIDRIVCTSEVYLKTSPVLKKYKYKTEAVSLGLDKRSFPVPTQKNLDKWLNLINQPFFLFLGVLRNYKGVRTLVDAASMTNANIVIAGGGPELDTLKKHAKSLKLENVIFTGQISEDDKAALLQLSTGLVLPSHLRSEAFGLVQLEAAMKAKPLVCTELGTGTSYVNEHENTGLVVPPKNPEALGNAMNFLTYHPAMAQRMGKEAEKRFKELFTAEQMCKHYARIYKDVVGKKSLSEPVSVLASAE